MSGTIYEEISPFFSDLLYEHGFRVIAETHEPQSFGDGLLILESKDFRLRFVRDRGQVFADVAPSGQADDDWHQLQRVLEFLDGRDTKTDARRAAGLDELSVRLKASYAKVQALFEKEAYPSERDALKSFEKEKSAQMFGNFTDRNE